MPPRRASIAVFLVSCALILFQVSFTRLVGYKLFYHFVFLSISLSLTGLGAAGTFAAIRPCQESELDRSLHAWLVTLLVSIPVCFLLIANPFLIENHARGRVKLLGSDAVLYLLWCAPLMIWLNFCGGVVLTRLFAAYSQWMGRLYARDLLGAGFGCLLCVALMKYGSPPMAFVFSTVLILAALATYHTAIPAGRQRATALSLSGAAMALSAFIFLGPASLRNFENFRNVGAVAHILKYEWNHLIRTDQIDDGTYVLDGDASTPFVNWSEQSRQFPVLTPAYHIGKTEPDVAIIGFGGGPQVLEARNAHARHITAIDINPTIGHWVSETDRVANGSLFVAPNIDLMIGEGRHSVQSCGRQFDLIVIHAIDTYAAAAAGAYALTENFLYTKEALQDYYRTLSPEGIISLSRWEFYPPRENLRLFGTALDALSELGVPHPERHVAMIAPVPNYHTLGKQRVWGYLMISRNEFTATQVQGLQNYLAQNHWSLLYSPGTRNDSPFDAYVYATDRTAFRRFYPYLISTVTDSNPYLFQFYDPLHASSYRSEGDWAVSDIYQSSGIVLLAALALATSLSVFTILIPLWWAQRRNVNAGQAPAAIGARPMLYFACLGVGFMALEVPLTQILSLHLGHPTYGFSVVLVALLISTGIGSMLVERISISAAHVCTVIALLLVALTVGIFPLVRQTMHMPDVLRFGLALLLVAACGVPMGFPLALGVRELGRIDPRSVAWAWAINGAASVIGSCLVMVVMVYSSSHFALGVGACCYAVAAAASRGWRAETAVVVTGTRWRALGLIAGLGGLALAALLIVNSRVDGAASASPLERQLRRGWIAYEQRRYDEAGEALSAALPQLEADPQAESMLVQTLAALTEIRRAQDQFSEAERYCRKLLEVREKSLPADHLELAEPLNNLAALLFTEGHWAESEVLIRRALAIREKALGPDHPLVALGLENYSAVLKQLKRTDEAARIDARVQAIRNKLAQTPPGQ